MSVRVLGRISTEHSPFIYDSATCIAMICTPCSLLIDMVRFGNQAETCLKERTFLIHADFSPSFDDIKNN